MKKTLINIAILVIIAAVLFFLYNAFIKNKSDEALLTSSLGEFGTTQNDAAQEIFTLLNSLERIQLDTSVFDSAGFKELRDFSVSLSEEEPGRQNPFAPLE